MKKEDLREKFSTKTWNKIRDEIPEEFYGYEFIKTWVDYKGNEKKIDLEYWEDHFKKRYNNPNIKTKLIYAYCQGAAQDYLSRYKIYLLIA